MSDDVKKAKKEFSSIFRYTPAGVLKWLRLKILGREIVIEGECLCCGRCCRRLNLSYRDRWLRDEKDFEEMFLQHEEYMRFRVTERTDDGLLVFECDKISEEGLCMDHENRPDLCREYPLPELPFTGAELLDHCGYSFAERPSFRKALAKAKKAGKSKGNAITESG